MSNRRVDRLRGRLGESGLDGMLVTGLLNVRYLTGFTGSSGTALVTPEQSVFLTDFRYEEQAALECRGWRTEILERASVQDIAERIGREGLSRLGFEEEHVVFKTWSELRDGLPGVELVPTAAVVERLRMVKEPCEIKAIRRAAGIADLAYEAVVSRIEPGMIERDVALELDFFMRKHGAEKEGFDTIVASGPRGALPHGKASDRVIGSTDLVVLDYGAVSGGYNSDITRTVIAGRPDPKQEEVYSVVLEAQRLAIEAIRPGLTGREIDAAARDFIASRGYGPNFGHGLGHGLGLHCHDPGTLSRRGEIPLEPGMVFTVEPGVYIAGWGGVRIEDDIVVTEDGCEVLTRAEKRLSLV